LRGIYFYVPYSSVEIRVTLIVGSMETDAVWMVGDTAITGGKLGTRDREYMPKIRTGRSFPALIAFAGEPEYGDATVERAAMSLSPREALDILIEASANDVVEFLYAASHQGLIQLYRVKTGRSSLCSTGHIGNTEAFRDFQRIRHGQVSPYAPQALKTLMCGVEYAQMPNSLNLAISAMLDLFALRTDRDVGGWAVPYVLFANRSAFCSYAYSVSDPVFAELVPGSLMHHGSAARGGSALSVSDLPDGSGIVAYWLQLPGGLVLTRSHNGYDERRFYGTPSQFKASVREALSLDVHLWFDDQPVGPATALHMLRGEDGRLNTVIADHGGPLSIAVHNLTEPFQVRQTIPVNGQEGSPLPIGAEIKRISDEAIELQVNGQILTLDAHKLQNLLAALATARLAIRPDVPVEFKGTSAIAIPDPVWRTEPTVHSAIPGMLLNLRHPGYGWLSFVLPDHEALKLGIWLVNCAEAKERDASQPSPSKSPSSESSRSPPPSS
jgi:hypothetical protein